MTVSKRNFLILNFLALLLLFVPQSLAQQVSLEKYATKQSTHTLRVATTVVRLLGDKEFLANNPEYKVIADRAVPAMKAALVHDKAKTLDTEFNRFLAESDGVDYRSLPDTDPRKMKMIQAVEDLNKVDETFWNNAMKKFSSNKKEQELLGHLVGAADYHDVPMSRAAEFGNGKDRNIDKASDWISKLKNYSDSEKQGMTKIARYLEGNPVKFQDIYTEVTPEKIAAGGSQKAYRKELKAEAKGINNASGLRVFKGAGKVLGVAGMAIGPGIAAKDYIEDPVHSDPTGDLIEVVSGSSSVSDCETIGCLRFYNHCKKEKLSEKECMNDFFSRPLSEQTDMRLGDDLDQKFKKANRAPVVTGLRCENSKDNKPHKIRFTTYNYNKELQDQVLELNESQKIINARISSPSDVIKPFDRIDFNNGEPDKLILYQKPRVSRYSKKESEWSSITLKKRDWVDKKLYFWSSGTAEQKTQIKRSQDTIRSVRDQANSLIQCCESSKCRAYFSTLESRRGGQTPAETVSLSNSPISSEGTGK